MDIKSCEKPLSVKFIFFTDVTVIQCRQNVFCVFSGFSEMVLDEEQVPFLEDQPAASSPQPQNHLDAEEG